MTGAELLGMEEGGGGGGVERWMGGGGTQSRQLVPDTVPFLTLNTP